MRLLEQEAIHGRKVVTVLILEPASHPTQANGYFYVLACLDYRMPRYLLK